MKEIDFIPDEKASELIDKVKKKAGLKTDQEALNMILHDAAKNFGKNESQIVEKYEDVTENDDAINFEASQIYPPSDASTPNYFIPKGLSNNLKGDFRIRRHEEYGIITKGTIDLLHNKIFPIAYCLYDLDYNLRKQKAEWVELEKFRNALSTRTKRLAFGLSIHPDKKIQRLADGFPKSPQDYQSSKKIKKSWSKVRKNHEIQEMAVKSFERFGFNYFGNVTVKMELTMYDVGMKELESKTTTDTKVSGACFEWGFLEIKKNEDKIEDPFVVRLSEKGKKFVAMKNLSLLKLVSGTNENVMELPVPLNFSFRFDEARFLLEQVFRNFPLEYKVMKKMLNQAGFVEKIEKNKKKTATDQLLDLFWKEQKSYLEQNYEEEFDRKMENPDSKNPFMKNKQSTPRARALAIMSRLREMGLYEKGKRSDYTITDNGKEISETL